MELRMSKSLPNISVGDFALDILKEMAKDPQKSLAPALKESTLMSVDAPDIKNVKVPVDFVNSILEGKRPVLNTKKPEVKTPTPIKESKENRLQSLVERLSGLVKEARVLLEEISAGATTTGNIGVTTAVKKKPKFKYADKLRLKYGLN